jgi:hypothetical protein
VFSSDLEAFCVSVNRIQEHFGLKEKDFDIFLDFDSEFQNIQDLSMQEGFENVFAMHKFFNEWIRQCEVFVQGGCKEVKVPGFDSGVRMEIIQVLRKKCSGFAQNVSKMMGVNSKDFKKEHWVNFLKIVKFDFGRR